MTVDYQSVTTKADLTHYVKSSVLMVKVFIRKNFPMVCEQVRWMYQRQEHLQN